VSKEQADKLAELTAKGWKVVHPPGPFPPSCGGPVAVSDRDGKLWTVAPDGSIKEEK